MNWKTTTKCCHITIVWRQGKQRLSFIVNFVDLPVTAISLTCRKPWVLYIQNSGNNIWIIPSYCIFIQNVRASIADSRVSIHSFIVRRAGLLWSQEDFEWRWSVPLFKCLTVLEFSFILFDLCLLITFFNFIMNYIPIVTFWIFTYHKIWILSIMFCSIWSYWIIYFLACLEVSWRVVS